MIPSKLDLTSIKRGARRGTRIISSELDLTSIERRARRGRIR